MQLPVPTLLELDSTIVTIASLTIEELSNVDNTMVSLPSISRVAAIVLKVIRLKLERLGFFIFMAMEVRDLWKKEKLVYRVGKMSL